jgi:hypothetical protein
VVGSVLVPVLSVLFGLSVSMLGAALRRLRWVLAGDGLEYCFWGVL